MLGLTPSAVTSVPFTVVDNRILVPVTIDGKRGFRVIVDTGSRGIAITPQAAASLHLRLQYGGTVSGAGAGTVAIQRAALADVTLADRHVRVPRATVIDLTRIRRAFHFPQLDGIIGYDALPSRYVRIDPDHRTLTLSDEPIASPANAHRVRYTTAEGLLQVAAAIDGQAATVILDTGDRSSLTIFEPFARAGNFYGVSPIQSNVITGYGVGGPIRANVIGAHLDAFGFALSDVVTRVPLGNAGVFSTQTQAGSVGNGTLLRFNTTYDRLAQTLTVWPSRAFAGTSPPYLAATLPRHGLFGAAIVDNAGHATIARVLTGTAAAAAGFLPGDAILTLNGTTVSNATAFVAALHLLHAGDRALVAIVRNGVKRQLTAVLHAPPDENDPEVTTVYGTVRVDGTLRRTLLTRPPNSTARVPGVLIMGGIGCYSIDDAADPQDAYMRLAHDLSRAGFATMRIEKSGVGDSQGPPCPTVDFEAEERSYIAAFDALSSDPHVDPSRVYLFGHSIGSIEAPQLTLTQHVAGVIVAEAVGRDWPEYELRNLRRQLELSGTAPPATDTALVEKQSCMQRLLFEKLPEQQIERADPSCKEHNAVYPVEARYMQEVAPTNVIALWSKIDVPVLAIYGQSDFVTEAADHERIVDVVNAHHAGSATYAAIDGMDHLLFRAATPKAAMEAFAQSASREYDADLSKAVVTWLQQHASKP